MADWELRPTSMANVKMAAELRAVVLTVSGHGFPTGA
jgi:hypothetical protein